MSEENVDPNAVDFDLTVDDPVVSEEKPSAVEAPVVPTEPKEKDQPKTTFTADDIATAVKAALKTPEEEPQVPELTPEEIDNYLKRAKYSVEDLKKLKIVSDETPAEEADRLVQVLDDIQRRAIQEAVATSQLSAQFYVNQLQREMGPVLLHVQQMQREKLKEEFYSRYEPLREHEEIVQIATNALVAEGKLTGKDFDTDAALVAERASSLLKKYGNIDIPISATQKSPVKGAVPKPAVSGGTGGRSQAPKASTPESSDEFAFYTYVEQ
ncbi:MAG: hypothetical protein HC840_01175 [Leptolyngbyaceae cyanobacterium RM2_2_4]|nr:hypothetical protein [Leptolyngbyaceae cyanobacterium RM2_2_4]